MEEYCTVALWNRINVYIASCSAYSGTGDFVEDSGIQFLKLYNIDIIGLGEVLSDVLPQTNVTLSISELA